MSHLPVVTWAAMGNETRPSAAADKKEKWKGLFWMADGNSRLGWVFFACVCVFCLHVCVAVPPVRLVPMQVSRECWMSQNCGYGPLWTTMCLSLNLSPLQEQVLPLPSHLSSPCSGHYFTNSCKFCLEGSTSLSFWPFDLDGAGSAVILG